SWFLLDFRFGDGYSLLAFTGFVSVKKLQDRKVYMVATPAVIQAGSEAKLCASLLQPNETLVMTISLIANGQNKTLLQESSDQEFHRCFQFQVSPALGDIQNHSNKMERKVMIKPYSPMTFVQTDKPIYNPGHTVQFRVITLDTSFSPVNQLYNIVELELSHPLNSEAPVGSYAIVVWIGENKIYHHFKVEKYVLPKFEIKMNLTDEISIVQEEYKVEVELCRLLEHNIPMRFDEKSQQGVPDYTPPCHKESIEMDQTGCASHVFNMSIFTMNTGQKMLRDRLSITQSKEKHITLSYAIGKLTFVNTPKIYEHGSIIEGKINVVHFNNTPISDMLVYLLEKKGRSSHRLQNLTTDSHGIASFSLNTTSMPKENIKLIVSMSKTSSSLDIQKMEKPLACWEEVSITIQYAIVGETVPKGSVDVIYLALSRGVIVQHGHMKVTVQHGSPEMAPIVQVLVYSMLPSETVIAHTMNFPTEKCFRHKVLVEFSPSKAVPGEENTLQLSAQPGSLCGLSAVDQSVHIMEPGKRLDADKIFDLLPVKETTYIPYELDDPVTCLRVRPRRYIMPYPDRPSEEKNQPYEVFQKLGLKLATNLVLRVPSCLSYKGNQYHHYRSYGPYRYYSHPVAMVSLRKAAVVPGSPVAVAGEHARPPPPIETVSVTPAPSLDYTLTPLNDVQYSSCLCANGRKTFSWTMAPSVLGVFNVSVSAEAVQSHTTCDNEIVNVPERGRIDIVTQSLLVKAEGTEKTDTYNWLLCPTGETLTEEVELQLPKNVVDGSDRISLSVLGYQRQLNYKHVDGAYSTFGQGSGNTWLTTFVLRSFGKAQSFIYIDPAKIEESKTWLERQQGKHGCFRRLGKLFNNRMKGGVTDEVTLTAYITASMLELNMSVSDPVVYGSLSCLRNSTSDLSNTYTTALLAYTFTLAGDMETRAQLLQHLDTIALQEGGLLHWTQTSSETSASLAVEISSYVLLASLSASPLSSSDLGYASRIIRWLVRQQNAYGGFSSTQDTVVALQALALYSTRVYSREGASTVTVQSPSGAQHLFDVNQNNKLLYQERTLQDTEGKYSVEVKGSACASVQVALHYNIPTPTDSTTLSIQVKTEVDCNSNSLRPRVMLKLQSQYHGKELTTNMIIVDLKMLSGFAPDPESLGRLRSSLQVDRVDTKDDHVLMYLTELPSLFPFNHTLDIIQELPVQNLKPAVVKIYDYYQPSDQAETEYVFPCK
ncbi:unnamed protein product, partial [Coregonus sp. 'balchen']